MIRLSIRRPVAVAMAYAAVAALGLFSWRNIPIEFLPDTELPRLRLKAAKIINPTTKAKSIPKAPPEACAPRAVPLSFLPKLSAIKAVPGGW